MGGKSTSDCAVAHFRMGASSSPPTAFSAAAAALFAWSTATMPFADADSKNIVNILMFEMNCKSEHQSQLSDEE
jgi:hypothetical protein